MKAEREGQGMQDSIISLGRGIDGVVGRLVDQFGDPRKGEHTRQTEGGVELLRYVIVNIASGRERVLHVDETLITDGSSAHDLQRRLLAPYKRNIDFDYLRVHSRVLRRWPRRPVGEPLPDPVPAKPAAAPRPPPPVATAAPEPAPTPLEEDALDRRLIEILAGADEGGLGMAQLVEQTGERSADLRRRLQRLAGAGTVRRAGDGLKTRYRLTNP